MFSTSSSLQWSCFSLPLVPFIDTWRWSSALLSRWRIWLWQCDAHSQVYCWRVSNHPRAVQAKQSGFQYRRLRTPCPMPLCLVWCCSHWSHVRIKHMPSDSLCGNSCGYIHLSLLFVTRTQINQDWRDHFSFWILFCPMALSCDGWGRWKRAMGQERRTAEPACAEGPRTRTWVCRSKDWECESILLEAKGNHTFQALLGLTESLM